MIKVLLIEDSPVTLFYLEHVLNSDGEIQVVATATDGERGVKLAKEHTPDVIVMDFNLPKMDGFQATCEIMQTKPVPIIIVSAILDAQDLTTAFQAMEAGAVAIVEKPMGGNSPNNEDAVKKLLRTIKMMSEVKVIRRWKPAAPKSRPPIAKIEAKDATAIKVVALGVSTGGPVVLQTIFSLLPKNFAAPIVIVQHISSGFINGMLEWLSKSSTLPLHIASQGEQALPGHVYFAPDDFQMRIDSQVRIVLSKDEPEKSLRPSVSYLFRSVAKSFGANSIGVLLTGMGADGAEELKLMKDHGAITVAQDKESCAIYGMPGEAVKLGAASYLLSPEKIVQLLINRVMISTG